MKKRLLSVFMLLVLLFSLSGCSNTNNPQQQESSKKVDEEDEKKDADKKDDIIVVQQEHLEEVPEEKEEIPEGPEQIDMSGDYIGDISCSNPPKDSTYTIYNNNDSNDCIVLYVENIDDCNIRFHLSRATMTNPASGSYTENVIFLEHIAHYTDSGYYEYIGKEYHLYFKYVNLYDLYSQENPERPEVVADHRVEVYGLEKLFAPTQYYDNIQYNGISGNSFHMNVPFTG